MTLHSQEDSWRVWAAIFYLKPSTYNATSPTEHLHLRPCALTDHLIREKIFSVSRTEKKEKVLSNHCSINFETGLTSSFHLLCISLPSPARWLCYLVEKEKDCSESGSSRGNMAPVNQWCSWINRKTHLPVQFVKLKISFMSREWIEFLLFYKEK